jgi:hypothetical protein
MQLIVWMDLFEFSNFKHYLFTNNDAHNQNHRILKQLKVCRLLRHVSVYIRTILREPTCT